MRKIFMDESMSRQRQVAKMEYIQRLVELRPPLPKEVRESRAYRLHLRTEESRLRKHLPYSGVFLSHAMKG